VSVSWVEKHHLDYAPRGLGQTTILRFYPDDGALPEDPAEAAEVTRHLLERARFAVQDAEGAVARAELREPRPYLRQSLVAIKYLLSEAEREARGPATQTLSRVRDGVEEVMDETRRLRLVAEKGAR
jgi:hypothetical protein